MGEYKLKPEIIHLSVANNWSEARLEWELKNIYIEDEPMTCLCRHHPIIEICEIRNTKNKNEAIVGNCCVKKFLGLPSDKIFSALARINTDNSRALNEETIKYAYKKG